MLARDGGKCRRCGKTPVQWAHIYSRRFLSIRWNPINALSLCAACHFWAHDHPLDFSEWVEKEIGPLAIQSLREKLKSKDRPDFDAEAAILRETLDLITG